MESLIEHLATILCTDVRPRPDGLLTLDGLVDMLNYTALPPGEVLVPVKLVVVTTWRRSQGPGVLFRQRIRFCGPDDWAKNMLIEGPNEIDLVVRHLAAIVTRIHMLPLRGPGQYQFLVERETPRSTGLPGSDEWEPSPPTAGLWVPSANAWPPPVDPERDRLKHAAMEILRGTDKPALLTTDILAVLSPRDFPTLVASGLLGAELSHALHELSREGQIENIGPSRNWRIRREA